MDPKRDKIVRIIPTEIGKDEKGRTLFTRQWQADKASRYFGFDVSVENLKPLLAKARVKLEKVSFQEEGDLLIYGYAGRPLLMLCRKDGLFYSPASEVETYGEGAVQHQAHIFLNLLKANGMTKATQGKALHSLSVRQVLGKLKSYGSGT